MLRYRLINPHFITALMLCAVLGSGAIAADQTLLKIDINATTNITHPGWEGWVLSSNGNNDTGLQSKTFPQNGIYVSFGYPSFTTAAPIYIEGFTNTYWGDFAGDMAEVRDPSYNQGDIETTIKNLSPGSYTLKTYHNPRTPTPSLNNLMDVNDKIGDGPWTRQVTDFDQQHWVPSNDVILANPCTLNFIIPQPNTDYKIRYITSYKHKTLTDPNIPADWIRNVGICGFELISHAIYSAYGASPAPDATIRYNTSYNLSWIAPDPYTTGDTLHYDVYFSTAAADMGQPGALLASYIATTSIPCPALVARTNYYWRVDTHGMKDGIEVTTLGPLWRFDTNNQAPTLDLGPAQVSFPGRTVTISATSTDLDGLGKPDPSVITYFWKDLNDSNDPNYVDRFGTNPSPFSAAGPKTQSVSFILDPNSAHVGTGRSYRFRCTASDGDKSTSLDMNVFVANETRCQLVKHLGNYYTEIKSPGDFNDDCIVDLKDLSLYVSQWLGCKAVNNVCP